MQINLNIYERSFEGVKKGKPFEPYVWHREEFLQKNFIRFFSPEYLVNVLYVVVPSFKHTHVSFSFEYGGAEVVVYLNPVTS
jgi:hypothetical protein